MQEQQAELTAKAWVVIENGTGKYWRGNNTMQKLQMASLTKMYTLQACFMLNRQINIHANQCCVQVIATTQVGTLAHLEQKKYILLRDLYYGLMLPSGNDAALLLAYYYGYWLGRKQKIPEFEWGSKYEKTKGDGKIKWVSLEGKKKYKKIYLTRFIAYMNSDLVKKRLMHKDTHFQNPHGLPDKLQRSTVWQIAYATIQFLKNKNFAQIVATKTYSYSYLCPEQSQEVGQERKWENTNILLDHGFIGVKTGHTVSAGNCLCSRKHITIDGTFHDLIIVVLGCQRIELRFSETQRIVDDLIAYFKMMS